MGGKARLLFTISELTYSSQVRNLVDLVSHLDRDLFEIEVAGLQINDPARVEIEKLDVPVFQLRLQPTRPLRASDFWVMAKSPYLLIKGRYSIVHSLLYQSIFTEAWAVKKLANAKYVYTKSNLEWDNHPAQWARKTSYADCVLSISKATSDLLEQKGFGDRTEKIFLGIDTDTFRRSDSDRASFRRAHSLPDDAFVFGCAAQFIEVKEHVTVIRAFEKIAAQYPDAHLAFCGPNHRDEYYRQFLDALDTSTARQRIHLLGQLQDMPAFYSAIDVFVLPSRAESFGYVYVEAMSCNRPVIACAAAGPLEIVAPGETGLFAKMSDSDDLAIQMKQYVDDPDMTDTHGRAARARAVDLFSSRTMARHCQALYLRLLESH